MSWRAWWCGQASITKTSSSETVHSLSVHALQLHNEYVDLKPDRMTKKEIMMAKLLAENF
jgi:hypothetical protein